MTSKSVRLLGVDIDLTIVNTGQGWEDYLKYYNGFAKVVEPKEGELLPYDLSEMYPNVAQPYDYWRTLDYNQFKPLEGSVEALEKLSNYFGIVFISRVKGTHGKSKYYWVKEHYPFMTDLITTHGKWLMGNSVECMIDDRLDVLEKFDFNKRILFQTPYTQSAKCPVAYSFSEWNDGVVKTICDMYL